MLQHLYASAEIWDLVQHPSNAGVFCSLQVFKDGKKIHEMVGASADNLEQLVEQLSKS